MLTIENSDDILTFIKVVQLGSFQAAADTLNISTSLTSKRIARLEKNLSATLLYRSTRRLTLTEIGRRYFDHVQSIPTQIQTAYESTLPLNDAMYGQFKLIIPTGFDHSIKQLMLPQFVLDYPDIEMEVQVVMNPSDHFNDDFDVLVTGKRPHEKFPDTNMICRKLMNLPAGIYASREYLQNHKKPTKPDDLNKHRCLSYLHADHWPFIDKNGQSFTIQVPNAFYTNSSNLLHAITCNNGGITYAHDYMFREEIKNGSVIKLLKCYTPKVLLECFAFYHHHQYQPIKTRTFIERLLNCYAPFR